MNTIPPNIHLDDFKKHWNLVYAAAYKLTAHPQEAEDLAQDTLMTAWEKIDQLNDVRALPAWLKKICMNKFLMARRKEKGYRELSYDQITALEAESASYQFKSPEPLPEEEVIADEAVREMRNGCFLAMTRKLTLNQRMAFSLSDMFGMNPDQAAAAIGVTPGAAKSLLHRARQNIDSFFAARCSLIYPENPCRCKAYLEFSRMKEDRQAEVRQKIRSFAFGEKPDGYEYHPDVRARVKRIYESMPDKTPSDEWFDSVINQISKK